MGCQVFDHLTLRGVVMGFVTDTLQVTEVDVLSDRRDTQAVAARAMFVWAIKSVRPRVTYSRIAQWLGREDHSSMIAAHRKAVSLRLTDPDFKTACDGFFNHYESHLTDVRRWLANPELRDVEKFIRDLRTQTEEAAHAA